MDENDGSTEWFIEGYLGDRKTLRRWMVNPVPYTVGRRSEMSLCLPFKSVSGRHAEFFTEGAQLWVRDHNSTNGTFVNRKRIEGAAPLHDGDVLHFADCEFRVGFLDSGNETDVGDSASHTVYSDLSESRLPELMAVGAREFKRMLLTQSIIPLFQPLVELKSRYVMGYEVLGRGGQEGLVDTPVELFRIAASLNLESELSRLFRMHGVAEAAKLQGKPKIFLNTHPAEMDSDKLLPSLKTLREKSPEIALVLEIHESAITDLVRMQDLRSQLNSLQIGLAYDDFGAGQARLLELVDVPPDYLKFDVGLVRGINEASPSKLQIVESLIRVAREIDVVCVAEGVETDEELRVCIDLGFELGQGFLLGRPAPVSSWAETL